jgi:ATP-dependent Lon protease
VHGAAEDVLNRTDVHLHFPAGAIPKDGPSAGVTIASALVSLLTGRICRSDTAMTGEITLRGLVLPVGGIREKVVAAHRAGLRRVILPERNRKDLAELPASVLANMSFAFVTNVSDVLEQALSPKEAVAGDSGTGESGAPRPDEPPEPPEPLPAGQPTAIELPAVTPGEREMPRIIIPPLPPA